jgi:lipocalin
MEGNKKGRYLIMANNTFLFDINQNIEQPDIYLKRRNLDIIGCLYPVESLKIKKTFNAFDEISFSIAKTVNGYVNPYWDKIVDLSVVFVQQFGNFEITVSTDTTGIVEKKNISGKSLEVELDHVKLFDFQINSDDIKDDSYSSIVLYNPVDTKHSLLHLALEKAPSWSILHVDDKLWSKQRTYDVNDVSVYSFLTSTVATELECVFLFDIFNRTISCFDINSYGNDTNVFIDCENYAKEITLEAPSDQIFNWFKISGGDDVIDVREVNPNNTNYVTYLGENDKADMSSALVTKLDNYNILYASLQTNFINVMKRLQAQVDVIWDLNNKYPATKPADNDYTVYGLAYLKSIYDGFQSLEDEYMTLGYGNTKDSHYSLYSSNHNKLLVVKSEISLRESQISAQETIQKQIEAERNAIQSQLDLENYLGTDLWLELSRYKRESTYSNDNYTVTDSTTDSERITMEQELLDRATENLKKACNPQPSLTSTISNLMAKPEFQTMALQDFQLGNFIHIGINDDYVAKIRLISIDYDFDNISDLAVGFSDMTKSGNIMSDVKSILDQAQSASASYDIVAKQMSNASDQLGFVS